MTDELIIFAHILEATSWRSVQGLMEMYGNGYLRDLGRVYEIAFESKIDSVGAFFCRILQAGL